MTPPAASPGLPSPRAGPRCWHCCCGDPTVLRRAIGTSSWTYQPVIHLGFAIKWNSKRLEGFKGLWPSRRLGARNRNQSSAENQWRRSESQTLPLHALLYTCDQCLVSTAIKQNSGSCVSSSALKILRHRGRYLKASYDLRTRCIFQFLFFINQTTFGSDRVSEQETSLEGKVAKQCQASRERAAVLLLRLVPTWLATTACTTSKVSEYQI